VYEILYRVSKDSPAKLWQSTQVFVSGQGVTSEYYIDA